MTAWLVVSLAASAHAEPKTPLVRNIFVPAHRPELWPKGDREPVRYEDYLELRRAIEPARASRRGAYLEWQSLSATFDPTRGALTEGNWVAEVHGSEDQMQLLSLEPLDLPLSELKWSDGEAIWGTTPTGAAMVVVDTASRRLEGLFSRHGRRLQRTWQFELTLAAAVVTELTLRVPAKYVLKCANGRVRGPLTSGADDWRLWQVHLGSQSRCEVLIMESPSGAPTVPVVVYDQSSSYILREADVEIQCEVNAEIFHTPKATLEFSVPDELSIYTVGFAGDSRLGWRDLPRSPGQPRQIEIMLPEPQIGRVRSLQILGGLTAKWEPSFVLPRISLVNGWFTSGRWNISVDAPLVWRALRPTGLRLTEINATSPTTRRLTFTQFLAEAALGIDISSPEPRLTAYGMQRITAREATWRLTSEWQWQSNSGVVFGARCRIPAGWEVLDVLSLPESAPSEVRHWDVVKEANGEQVLMIDFSTPLEGSLTHRVRVLSRRTRTSETDRDTFELPTSLDCRHSEQLLIAQPPVGWRWDVSGSEVIPGFTAIKRLGSPWLEFELWKEEAPHWTPSTVLNRMTQVDGSLRPITTFVSDVAEPVKAPATPPDPSSTPARTTTAATNPPFRDAATELLVWASAELRSLMFPGGDDHDVHLLTLKAAQPARVSPLEFDLPAPAEVVLVRINGVRADVQREGQHFRLPAIPQGGLQSLEVQYRVPSDRDFLRNRQTLPVPRVTAPVLGFRWLFAFPPTARLSEEPKGLRLLQPLEPTPWSRRFFGPLGRDTSKLFNPLSWDDWQELWEPPVATASEERTLETLFAPPGWRVREAVAATLPTEISWLTWNGSQVRVLAWVGMLLSVIVGCVLRVRRAQPRVQIAALWLGVCAVGVVLSAPVYAEVLGGCFVGAMMAALIPRRLIMSYAQQVEAAGRGAFEATVALDHVVSALIVVALVVTSSCAGQETPRVSESAGAPPETFDILIPVDNPVDATGSDVRPSEQLPLVFVPKPLLQQWRQQQARQAEPTSLMESARFEFDWQAGSLRAEFVVHRLRPEQPLTLRFPFVTVPLAGPNACQVDGQPRAMTVSEARDALLLQIPETSATGTATPISEQPSEASETAAAEPRTPRRRPTTHRVVISLLPPIVADDPVERVRLNVPPVLASHIVVKSPPGASVEVPTRRGELKGNADAGVWTVQLGKLTDWSLELLKPGVSRPRTPTNVKADVACLAEVTPTALRQRYRVRYSVVAGELNEVAWLLPRGALVREGEVTADDLLNWSLEPQSDGRQRLRLEFSRPQKGEFVVDVSALQPPLGTLEHPRWEPWTIDPDGGVSGATKIALGVLSVPGFKVTAPADAERIVPMTEAAFVASWGSPTLARQPQLSLQVSVPIETTFTFTPLMPQRKVRQELLLKVGRQTFEWALYAEVTTTGSPAFQHEITVAPHFRADQVSVTEDEAERLVSWTQTDQRLSLFLRDSTTGIQNVVLQGRDAVPSDGRLRIPTRWFADADSTEFSMRITHDPAWQVEVLDDQQQPLNPVEPASSVPEQPELVLLRCRADPKLAALDVRLTRHQPAARAVGWTQVAQDSAGTWTWRHVEQLLDEGQITARMFWPAAWAKSGSITLSPALKELARRTLPDGIELTVQSLPDVSGAREVFFESPAARAPDEPTAASGATAVRLVPPTSLDVADRVHHWLLAESAVGWLPMSARSSLQPFEESTGLPASLSRGAAANETRWLTLPTPVTALELTRPETEGLLPAAPKLLWMETTVWVADGAMTQGRTWLLLQPHGLREFVLDCPGQIRWLAAFVGDKPCELPDPSVGTPLNLENLPDEPLLWLSVFWHIDATPQDRIVARRDARLPMPADPNLRPPRHDLTFISSGHSELSSTRGARRVQNWEASLARAAQILRALPNTPDAMTPALRRLWTLAEDDLARARTEVEQLSELTTSVTPAAEQKDDVDAAKTANESIRQRLQTMLAEAATVRARLTASEAANLVTLVPESWTSDSWHQIPQSWNAISDFGRSAQVSIIVVDRRWLIWIVALLAAACVIPLFRIWLRWQVGEWLAAHPYFAWACLGLLWWACLAPSVIGFGLLLVAALMGIRQRWSHGPRELHVPEFPGSGH